MGAKETTMLQDGHVYAKLPAADLERARRFCVDTLGFRPEAEGAAFLRFRCADGTTSTVFTSSGRPSGDHDQCGWVVDDIEAEVAELRRRGVVFPEFPGNAFEDGIGAAWRGRVAWFRDPEGDLLNLRGYGRDT